jgi:hypothetical protein
MKLHAALLAFFVMGFGAPVLADTIENSYGNTIEVTAPNGQVSRYYFEPDGRFTMTSGAQNVEGQWVVRGEEICITVPDLQPDEACHPYFGDKDVGDEWDMAVEGGSVSFKIIPGRS